MKSTLRLSISLIITLIFIIGTVVFRLLPAIMPIASAKTVTIGVGVYWDKDCTNAVSLIEWGTMEPGATVDRTVYVRSEGNSTVTLSLTTGNWNPVTASDYISLSWNYGGELISPNVVLQITLTLSISPNIKGITSFSFEIIITYVRAGLLKIETNPPLPATLYIDGTSVNPWGLDYLPLPSGNYIVRFGDVPYYVTPLPQNVTIIEGEVTTVVGTYVKAGLLKMETNPPLPATLYVDGVARAVWGLDYLPITPGNHMVRFGDVPYYVTPPSQNITIQADEVKVVVGNYIKAGLLKVETDPPVPGVIYVNGTAKAVWGLDCLPVIPGIYSVSFGNVDGYVMPQPQIVSVLQDQVTVVVGKYTASEVSYSSSPHGFLKIETDPPVAATLYLNDVPVDPWGLEYLPLPAGVYRIRFGDVPYYVTPSDQVATVIENQTTVVVGVYIKAGLLKIETRPPVPVTLYLDGRPVATWGLDFMPLPPGNYIIIFGDAPEYVGHYVTSPEKTVTLIQDKITVVVGNYIRAGLLKVETNPAVPSVIYVNGTARAVWGLDYLPLAPGTYLVSFGEVFGFVAPPAKIIIIEEDKITRIVGNFIGS